MLFFVLAGLSWSCATYYQKNMVFQQAFETGQFQTAQQLLAKNEKLSTGPNQVLYHLNFGTASFMNSDYLTSIDHFKKADLYVEDYNKNLGLEALALVSNPMVKPYRPEYFESVMIHFYQALNFLNRNDYEGALVEARRINLQLQRINDQFKNNTNKYARDAFGHLLMGLIYDAQGDFNNAFIAYRNALEIYENEYTQLYENPAPDQLKQDILRTAALTGFYDQLDFYERKFGLKYEKKESFGQVICFWLNGMGPVKSEWSINFINTGSNNGWITLANQETGMSFPIFIGNKSGQEQSAFSNFRALRVAFPKYVSRPPQYRSAQVVGSWGEVFPLELVQNVNRIAFQSLQDRMWREMASSLARLATKKALEELAYRENKNIGAVVSIVNAMTEKADTRNWQTLPFAIHYTRVALPEGTQQISIVPDTQESNKLTHAVSLSQGATRFVTFHHL